MFLLSGKLFVKDVIVYADESGTHDKTGQSAGSKCPIVAGFAAPVSEWSKFCVEWQAVLKGYGAPYFHSRELRAAKAALEQNKKATPELRRNPYYGWPLARLDKFLVALAKLAGGGNKVMIAGAIKLPVFHKLKLEIPLGEDPYKYCISAFFEAYESETRLRWGNFKSPVSFIFDQNDNPEWARAVHEAFRSLREKDPRVKDLAYGDKKDARHLPLQAADLLAYNIRRRAEESLTKGEIELASVEHALYGKLASNAAIKRRALEMNRIHRVSHFICGH